MRWWTVVVGVIACLAVASGCGGNRGGSASPTASVQVRFDGLCATIGRDLLVSVYGTHELADGSFIADSNQNAEPKVDSCHANFPDGSLFVYVRRYRDLAAADRGYEASGMPGDRNSRAEPALGPKAASGRIGTPDRLAQIGSAYAKAQHGSVVLSVTVSRRKLSPEGAQAAAVKIAAAALGSG